MREYVPGMILAAVFVAVPAFAQDASPGPQRAQPHRSFFTSNESRTDVPARVAKMFAALDTNHDGFVTKDEIAASQSQFDARMAKGAPKRASRMFDRLDSDHDGRVTLGEAEAARSAHHSARGKQPKAGHALPTLFKAADTNRDDVVTRTEFDAAVAAGKIKPRHTNMRGSLIVRLFDSADTRKEGRISLDEAQQAALRQFDIADGNHDGVVTPDERRQSSKAAKAIAR